MKRQQFWKNSTQAGGTLSMASFVKFMKYLKSAKYRRQVIEGERRAHEAYCSLYGLKPYARQEPLR